MSNISPVAAQEVVTTQGTVKKFNPRKGYGFIICPADGGGEVNVFVHQKNIMSEGFRTLYEGEVVQFEVVPSKMEGKWEAKNVVVITPSKERAKRDAKASKWATKKATDASNGNEE